MSGIESEYRFRQKICWLPAPVEVLHDGTRVAAAYFTCLPGDLAMLGGVRAAPGAEGLAVDLLRQQLRSIQGQLPRAHIQAAIPDFDRPTQQIVRAAGFEPLTAVEQLWSSVVDNQITQPTSQTKSPLQTDVEPKVPMFESQLSSRQSPDIEPHIQWRPAGELSRRRFVQLIGATFDGTLDCPELNDIRTNEQVLQSFLMKRPFRSCPNWFTLWSDNQLAGCLLLLAHNRELVELVYMGLVPKARGRGLGKVILEQAKLIASRLGATIVVLAADVRNAPAIKIYRQNGFQFHRQLEVYWYR